MGVEKCFISQARFHIKFIRIVWFNIMHEYDLYNIIYNQISKQTRKYQNINGQEICERD
jgi:hypothetical protein